MRLLREKKEYASMKEKKEQEGQSLETRSL